MNKYLLIIFCSCLALSGSSQTLNDVFDTGDLDELHLAIQKLPSGEDFWQEEEDGALPLYYILGYGIDYISYSDDRQASIQSLLESLKICISKGADLNGYNKDKKMTVFTSFIDDYGQGMDQEIILGLVDLGADPFLVPGKKSWSLMTRLTTLGDAFAPFSKEDFIGILNGLNIDIDQEVIPGYTILMNAIYNSNYTLVEALLEMGADPNMRNESKTNGPLDVTMWIDDMELAELLLENGADPNTKCPACHLETYIHRGSWSGNDEFLPLFIEYGGDISIKDEDGKTALHWALEDNNLEAALLLIQEGADLKAVDNEGKTVKSYAEEVKGKYKKSETYTIILDLLEN